MPICPRCGKCLSSDQALTYHLNRKYRCGTWKCNKCNEIFNTKFQLQMHEMKCLTTDSEFLPPNTDLLLQMYNNLPFIIVDKYNQNDIKYVSPYLQDTCTVIKDINTENEFRKITEYNEHAVLIRT